METAKMRQTKISEYIKLESQKSNDEDGSSSNEESNEVEGQKKGKSQIEQWSRIIKVSGEDQDVRGGYDISEDYLRYDIWVDEQESDRSSEWKLLFHPAEIVLPEEAQQLGDYILTPEEE